MGKTPVQLLQHHQLRVTKCRKDVLKTFLDKKVALTHGDLEEELKNDFDRVTIYRTLKTFLDSDLVHKVLDDSGSTMYALCSHTHEGTTHHHHEHVHFKCERCGNTTCIDEVSLPAIELPKGFSKKEISLLVQGICDKCN